MKKINAFGFAIVVSLKAMNVENCSYKRGSKLTINIEKNFGSRNVLVPFLYLHL